MSYDDELEYGDRQLIATYGRPVRLPPGLGDEPVLGIFDNPYGRVDLPHSGFIEEKIITLTVISSEFDGVVKRDVIEIPRKKPDALNTEWHCWELFTVRDIQPDGAGLSVIYLDPKTTSSNSESEIY